MAVMQTSTSGACLGRAAGKHLLLRAACACLSVCFAVRFCRAHLRTALLHSLRTAAHTALLFTRSVLPYLGATFIGFVVARHSSNSISKSSKKRRQNQALV